MFQFLIGKVALLHVIKMDIAMMFQFLIGKVALLSPYGTS